MTGQMAAWWGKQKRGQLPCILAVVVVVMSVWVVGWGGVRVWG